MFRCHFCNQVTPPKTTRHTVVIAIREKDYPTRRKESKRPGGRFRGGDDAVQDRGGKGSEIAKEVSACPACAEKQHEAETIGTPDTTVSETEQNSSAAEVSSATTPTAETTDKEAPAKTLTTGEETDKP